MSEDIPVMEQAAAEFRCAKLIARFFNALDDVRMADASECFAPDGIWSRQGKELHGPAQVLEELNQRSPTVSTRHLMSNADLTLLDADRVEGQFIATVYARHGDPDGNGHAASQCNILLFDAQFTRNAGDWRIMRLSRRVVFEHKS